MKASLKERYLSSAFILLASTVIVKIIGAVYKIPLTAYIGAEGRGYFAIAYNLCLPIHAITMGAFPIALTRLVSSYCAKHNNAKVMKLRRASKRLFLIVGFAGLLIMLLAAKPYANIISTSPNSFYTILALAPSIFFSSLCACDRSFCEGFMDMKATAIAQLIEAVTKMLFGLLFARLSMSYLYENYLIYKTVLGFAVTSESEALSLIYPITSACAMLGATLGSIVAYVFCRLYISQRYCFFNNNCRCKDAYNELIVFSASLVGATAVQSISNFIDTSSVQYFLSCINPTSLKLNYIYSSSDIYSYALGVYSAALDFKNLVPSMVMTLGVVAVPALTRAYECGATRFSSLYNSIIKYSVILSVFGGLILSLFGTQLLAIFYYSSSPDIAQNGSRLLFMMGITILPCCLATTTVYCTQTLGFAKSCIPAFAVACVLRIVLNYLLMVQLDMELIGAIISNAAGYLVIIVMNTRTIRSKTMVRISIIKNIICPILGGVLVYIFVSRLINHEPLTLIKILLFGILTILLYSFMLIITKTVTIKSKINLN